MKMELFLGGVRPDLTKLMLGLKIPALNYNSRQLLLLTVKPVLISRHLALHSANSKLRCQTLFPIFTVATVTRK